jgi:hypothetical protein
MESSPTLNNRKNTDSTFTDLKLLLFHKINYLTNYYHFTQSYSSTLTNLFLNLTEILSKKVTHTLNQNKNFIKFFKEITGAYQRFSTDLIKANLVLAGDTQSQTENSMYGGLFSNNLNGMIEQTQETIANNFYLFSHVLQTSIITQGPFSKVNEFYKRLNGIVKGTKDDLDKISQQKEKIYRVFTNKYITIFNEFKKYYNDTSALNKNILNKNDFFLIELDLIEHFNSFTISCKEFFKNFLGHTEDIRTLLLDYLNAVKQTMEIYINENRKIFSGSMNINLDTIHNFYESITKESLQINFGVSNIFNEDEIKKEFNLLVNKYSTELMKFNIYNKSKEEVLYSGIDIVKFKTLDEFINLFIDLNPMIHENIKSSELVKDIHNIKRDPGMFKSWKNCKMYITEQNNLLFFDYEEHIGEKDDLYEKFLYSLNLRRAKLVPKNSEKHPFRFEIAELKKGVIFNSNLNLTLDTLEKEKYEKIKCIVDQAKLTEEVINSEENKIDSSKDNKDLSDGEQRNSPKSPNKKIIPES